MYIAASILVLLPITIAVFACWQSLLDYTRYDPKFFSFSMQMRHLVSEETSVIHEINLKEHQSQRVNHEKYFYHKVIMATSAVLYLIVGAVFSLFQTDIEPFAVMSAFTTASLFFFHRVNEAQKRRVRWIEKMKQNFSA